MDRAIRATTRSSSGFVDPRTAHNFHLCITFVTGWMGENHFTTAPTALYGAVALMAAVAYYILQSVIIAQRGCDSNLAAAIGRDFKGKISPVLYAVAIASAFFRPWISCCLYVLVAFLWLVPDRRIERVVAKAED